MFLGVDCFHINVCFELNDEYMTSIGQVTIDILFLFCMMLLNSLGVMISTKEIEEYVNGGINEHEFLMRVAKDTDLDDLNLLNRVESVAASLNLKLRHEVVF